MEKSLPRESMAFGSVCYALADDIARARDFVARIIGLLHQLHRLLALFIG